MTNKIVLRSIEQFMTDYVPTYQPLYPLFLGKSVSYPAEVGKLDFRRVQTVGDIRAKHITPKDTEIKQIAVNESKKAYKKYFLAKQYVNSSMQDQQGLEEVVARVLDEHHKQADELLLFGEGTSASTMINNGLYWSNDTNYVLESSVEVAAGTDHLIDLQKKVAKTAADADLVAGRKLLVFYGTSIVEEFDGVYASHPVPFKRVLAEVLGPDYSFAKMPKPITPGGANGWMIVNLDQIKLHYTALPSLFDQGVNSEKMYAWFNFLMGSMMTEVLASGGIIRQPATLGA